MDIVNVIYDIRHTPQDYGRLLNEFEEQGIVDYKFWDAVVLKDKPIVDSIAASHKMIVRWAKDNNISQCCVVEQDATFTSPNAWKYFLDNKPEIFDLYLWGSHTVPLQNSIVCGFQLYIIAEKFYDQFLAVPNNNHIDTAMCDIKGDYHFCYPFPCLQRPGYSVNNDDIVNYTVGCGIQEKDIYRG